MARRARRKAAELLHYCHRTFDKLDKAYISGADESPDKTKNNQGKGQVAETGMPNHGIAANLYRDEGRRDTGSQQPMKQPRWQIPDAKLCEFLRMRHGLHYLGFNGRAYNTPHA